MHKNTHRRPVLLFGATGQLGRALAKTLPTIGPVVALARADCDVTDSAKVQELVRTLKPHVIVNAAAYTAVDAAETNVALATRVNAHLPRLLAQEAERLHAWLVHYSTDYVFDGRKAGCYEETDQPNPLNVYGQTKLQGEQAVIQFVPRHLVLRTSWLFSCRPGNFLTTILTRARQRDTLQVVNDQRGAPTGVDVVAQCTARMLAHIQQDTGRPGLYHLASAGVTTWHAYAQYILEQAAAHGARLSCGPQQVQPVSSRSRGDAAPRPANSCLNTTRVRNDYGIALPCWHQQVANTVARVVSAHAP